MPIGRIIDDASKCRKLFCSLPIFTALEFEALRAHVLALKNHQKLWGGTADCIQMSALINMKTVYNQ